MVWRRQRATPTVDLSWLPERLAAAGYDGAALKRWFGARSLDDVGLLNRASALERCRHYDSAAACLLRLFFLESVERVDALRAAFDDMELARMLRAGLLRTTRAAGARCVVARVRIDPVDDLLILADRRFSAHDPGALGLPAGDPVYPPSSDSLLLAEAATAASGPALDLGTGSGVLGLRLARAGNPVRAIDINPRAVALSALNAHLNRIADFESVEADLYRREGSRQFATIVANPPFVTSPHENAPSFHAGGPTGDRVLRRILRGLTRALADDGRAFAIAHIGLRAGRDLEAVAAVWFRDFAGSALVVEIERGDAVDLAAAQALYALDRGLSAYADEVRQWADFLRFHAIETVAAILVAARQDGRGTVEVVDARPKVLPIPLGRGPVEVVDVWLQG